ncbi:MAG: prenyltransferase [Deltaproteobacteria bacterium]|nr:prenyltransferase [Deltaproteobacteria bacterium]
MGPMRPRFLILTPACVFLGLGSALWTSDRINISYFILALTGALAAHISVNALNEYFDFKSGLDLKTVRTPFSGGTGTLPAHPEQAVSTLVTGLTAFSVTGLIGLYFLSVRGWGLLPLGLLGLISIIFYTPLITRSPFFCLITPGLGFGPFMVMGTDYVLTGSYSWTAFIASLIPFFLVNNLLLLNQFPDTVADKSTGRWHLPIAVGRKKSALVYGLFLFMTYLSIAVGIYLDQLPQSCLLGMASLVIAVPATYGAVRYAEHMEKLKMYMTLNVVLNILTPILVSIGFLAG